MSEANSEIIRRGIEAYNNHRVDDLIALSDPEVELVPVRSLLEGGFYMGHEGLRRFFDDMDGDWAERRVEIEEVSDHGDSVLVFGEFHAVSSTSGNEIGFPLAWLTKFRDGKLLRMQAYTDREAAVAAARGEEHGPSVLEAGMRQMAAIFNERGPAVLDDPDYHRLVEVLVHPDFEGTAAGKGALIQPGTHRGVEGYLRFVRNWNDVWSEINYGIERYEESGDRGAASVRVCGHGRGSGIDVDMMIGWEFEIRDDQLYRWRIYQDAEEAFAAAGIGKSAAAD